MVCHFITAVSSALQIEKHKEPRSVLATHFSPSHKLGVLAVSPKLADVHILSTDPCASILRQIKNINSELAPFTEAVEANRSLPVIKDLWTAAYDVPKLSNDRCTDVSAKVRYWSDLLINKVSFITVTVMTVTSLIF